MPFVNSHDLVLVDHASQALVSSFYRCRKCQPDYTDLQPKTKRYYVVASKFRHALIQLQPKKGRFKLAHSHTLKSHHDHCTSSVRK